jgi:glycine/D-amino acid oxidase-like deaminating enzyme
MMHSAVVIGGGFYGVAIGVYLARRRHLTKVVLVEREPDLLLRASYNNQARIHNGYHYPRSFTTAYRSRVNYPRFLGDFPGVVKRDFTKIYAIARRHSKVTARQFVRFCNEIGARLEPAPPSLDGLFNPRLIERAFLVEETAFDATALAAWARQQVAEAGIDVRLDTRIGEIQKVDEGLVVRGTRGSIPIEVPAHLVFNCTYSGLNQYSGSFTPTTTGLKHEITEMALMRAPSVLSGLGITVMDGPFFSMMPFPARGLHSLSHVRYTPHVSWSDERGDDPYQRLSQYPRTTRVDRMTRDVSRYLPAILDATYVESLFEVKTVLVKNEVDDGRPILFEKSTTLPGLYSILGGKIDNIYDVLERLDSDRSIDAVAGNA